MNSALSRHESWKRPTPPELRQFWDTFLEDALAGNSKEMQANQTEAILDDLEEFSQSLSPDMSAVDAQQLCYLQCAKISRKTHQALFLRLVEPALKKHNLFPKG